MSILRLLKPVLSPAVRGALTHQFDRSTIQLIVDDAFGKYEAQLPELPREASSGGQAMVHFAALTIGLYQALLSRGKSPSEARTLTAQVTARIYRKMATAPTVLSGVGASSPHDRVVRATSLFRRFPFSPPSYEMVDVDGGKDVVAFDVLRCPVAEYFRQRGLSELCVESWCNLDFELAERWGAQLERGQTIAGGASHCDFRWRTQEQHGSHQEAAAVSRRSR